MNRSCMLLLVSVSFSATACSSGIGGIHDASPTLPRNANEAMVAHYRQDYKLASVQSDVPPEDSPVATTTAPPRAAAYHPLSDARPTFDRKQTAQEIDSILKDGRPHTVSVLFNDSLGFRVIQGAGKVQGANGRGITSIKHADAAMAQLDTVLQNYKFKRIKPMPFVDQMSETELDAEEKQVESKIGIDYPNTGSYAYLDLENYSPQIEKALVLALQHLPCVREASVLPVIGNNAVVYRQPPSDPKFPSAGNWQANDYLDTEDLDSDNVNPRDWWWNRHSTGLAWDYTKGSGVLVGVVDSSFKTTLNDQVPFNLPLRRHYYKGTDGNYYYDSNVDPDANSVGTDEWHGTAVASVLAAKDNNNIAVCGIAPQVSVIPVRVDNDLLSIYWGVRYAADSGARVISLSKGPSSGQDQDPEHYTELKDAFTYARSKGALVVYAAGNSNSNITYENSIWTGALVIGGINQDNSAASDSNYGSRVDMAAADQSISMACNCYFPTNDENAPVDRGQVETITAGGTSFSAPLVAGAAAMVASYCPDVDEVYDIVKYSTDWAWDSTKSMRGNLYDPEPLDKIRVLNAGSAVWIAANYNASYPYEVYRPASDDYTQIKTSDGSFSTGGWFPQNLLVSFTPGSNVQDWSWNSSTPYAQWAGSTVIFKDRTYYNSAFYGAPRLEDAAKDPNGNPIYREATANLNSNGTQTGWVGATTWVLP